MLLHCLILLWIFSSIVDGVSLICDIRQKNNGPKVLHNVRAKLIMQRKFESNMLCAGIFVMTLSVLVLLAWLGILLTRSGDIHPNPGPEDSINV